MLFRKRNHSPLKWSKGNVEHPDRAGSQLPLNMLSVRYTPMPSSPCYMHVFTVRAATLLAEEEQTNPAGPSKHQLQPQPSQQQQQQRPTPPSNAAKQPRPASTSDAFGTVQHTYSFFFDKRQATTLAWNEKRWCPSFRPTSTSSSCHAALLLSC